MWFSGQLAADISPAFSETLSTVLGVEVCELTGPNAAPLDGWAALRSGERIACVFDRFDAVRKNARHFPFKPPSCAFAHIVTTERGLVRSARASCSPPRPTLFCHLLSFSPV